MTRQQVIDWLAEFLWTRGLGSRKSNHITAAAIADKLIAMGVLVVVPE